MVKLLLILLGTLIAGLASFLSSEPILPLSFGQVAGLTGTFLAFLGALFVWRTEDELDVLEEAQLAISEADRIERERDHFLETVEMLDNISKRIRSTHLAGTRAVGLLERAAIQGIDDEIQIISGCLLAIDVDLRIAFDFGMSHVWTICIYERRTDHELGPSVLVCVAHDRSIKCDVKDARPWKEGVGVGGMALAKNAEVVAPDILDPSTGSLFSLSDGAVRAEDLQRYRSMIAVPIHVNGDDAPWGVVLASSSKPDHFGNIDVDEDEDWGMAPEEAARFLAGLVALSVAIARANRGETIKPPTSPPMYDEQSRKDEPTNA
ncbi:hypothetical protein ATO8_09783 [Roseivivax marinus]|uniref:GAF domain-containing protein n=1 Tax=Roseivivax marinus TaxID=1379903 RepID=W4HJD3_9RHOB|nr:hypothetical protein [Roseivivax marinus]ETW12824.1 hypothetical protein ATO8_09783 [Roseivivax marinus]